MRGAMVGQQEAFRLHILCSRPHLAVGRLGRGPGSLLDGDDKAPQVFLDRLTIPSLSRLAYFNIKMIIPGYSIGPGASGR
jgi:hypothetical protein